MGKGLLRSREALGADRNVLWPRRHQLQLLPGNTVAASQPLLPIASRQQTQLPLHDRPHRNKKEALRLQNCVVAAVGLEPTTDRV